ncbi:hypothetical protein RHSIM_Rhsim03G0079600 [Rhododendron simsii]|uniref:DUF4378 domain-containing protein n=1 Tax=Rhododendron simsii TaxID=118357 RepID=A0A834H8K9_RHOSS|nr:hypothetical protein RHSIM_Rhsim03G0079600 [Rhododendron simsii]
MMMGHKHLHELLKVDQEPFLLKNYILDRCSQLNRPVPKTKLDAKKKLRPNAEISNPKRTTLWKQACFIPLHPSPDVKNSPWPATAKSQNPCKCKRQNSALLLEAARRITQNQSKPKTQIKNGGFGLFGSVMKRLRGKSKTRSRKREIEGKVGVEKSDFEMGFGCSCKDNNSSRRDSGASVSSRDVETCRRWEEIIGFGVEESSSPFRFSLEKSNFPSPRKPDFSSPATSPRRCDKQEKCGIEGTPKIQLEEEKEEKEQCSPVSVLDPPFKDDEDGREDGGDPDGYDLECSSAIIQTEPDLLKNWRAKQKLLEKLLRFEKLAKLDPIELEKRMPEDQEEEEEDDDDDDEVDSSLDQFNSEKNDDQYIREVLVCRSKYSADMKRLVIDLIAEEKRQEEEGGIDDCETVVSRVCERLDSWKEVESNTIDMMVEFDFRRETDGWKRTDREQVIEIAVEIEISIFGLLEEELYRSFASGLFRGETCSSFCH